MMPLLAVHRSGAGSLSVATAECRTHAVPDRPGRLASGWHTAARPR